MGFLATLLMIYLCGVLFFRFLLPVLVNFGLRRWQKKMQGQAYQTGWQTSAKREGEVTVDMSGARTGRQKSSKIFKSSDGDYVDYEEVK